MLLSGRAPLLRLRKNLYANFFYSSLVKAESENQITLKKWIHFAGPSPAKKKRGRIGFAACLTVLGLYQLSSIREVDSLAHILVTKLILNFLDPETAHTLVISAGKRGLLPQDLNIDPPFCRVFIPSRFARRELRFCNPVGLSAGFDKNVDIPLPLLKTGFGHVEVGTITPESQDGNPKPRVFRLKKDEGIINRYGFNSQGGLAAEERLVETSQRRWNHPLTSHGILGVNIGKNKLTKDPENDIRIGIDRLGRFADYVVLNVSSPNTPGLRGLQKEEHLRSLIRAAIDQFELIESEKTESRKQNYYVNQNQQRPFLFVKISPDLTTQEREEIAKVVLEESVDGLIVSNTTISRPATLESDSREEAGGLSGRPLFSLALKNVEEMYRLTDGRLPIIASGGISSGQDALRMIEAGACLVQIYTSMIYGGPGTARMIKDELFHLLFQQGYRSLTDAVGAKHRRKIRVKRKLQKAPKFD